MTPSRTLTSHDQHLVLLPFAQGKSQDYVLKDIQVRNMSKSPEDLPGINQVVFILYLLNSFSKRGTPTSPAYIP